MMNSSQKILLEKMASDTEKTTEVNIRIVLPRGQEKPSDEELFKKHFYFDKLKLHSTPCASEPKNPSASFAFYMDRQKDEHRDVSSNAQRNHPFLLELESQNQEQRNQTSSMKESKTYKNQPNTRYNNQLGK